MKLKYKKLIRTTIIILAILLIGVTYVFAFPHKASDRIESDTMNFEATFDTAEEFGFIDANTLSNDEKLVADNGKFRLYLNENTSHFYVENILTGERIESNPQVGELSNRQKSTVEFYSFGTSGNRSSRNENYSMSISHQKTPANEAGYRTYKLKEIENGFQVFYKITDITIDESYFPKFLSPEVYEPIIENNSGILIEYLKAVYGTQVDRFTGMYNATGYENLRQVQLDSLYVLFYEDKLFGEYSPERVAEENAENGYFDKKIKFGFDIAIQVTINEEGFEVKVINDSIVEYSDSKLAEIAVYPYLGTAISHDPISSEENEGYIVLPDGSGAILEFNNGKTGASDYGKRIYDFDIAKLPMKMPESQQSITMPIYGMVKEKIGFTAIITEGDAMTRINAAISGEADDYNKVFPSFILRETEPSVLGSGWNTYNVNLWSRNRAEIDYTIKFVILSNESNSYTGVAKAYQNYLVNEKGLVANDSSNENKVIVEMLGSFDTRKFFLGVPYKAMDTLTTFKQAEEIVDELIDLGVDNMDIIFNGITSSGLNNGLENKVKFDRNLGGKKGFERLENNLTEKNINVYPVANITTTNSFNRAFDEYKYSSKRISGSLAKDFTYHIPTRLPYSLASISRSNEHYAISPRYYETFINQRNKSYRFNNLALTGIGSTIVSDFIKGDELYAQEAIKIQERLLSSIENQNILLSNPFGFALPYTDLAVDLPNVTTLYQLLDYGIPLVQLVLSGYVDYSSNSINMANERDIDYNFLKVLETGSNLKYTLSYENSLKLLNTEHNQYMSTEYINWINLIAEQNDIINNLGIHEGTLINHERLLTNVYKSTYSNGLEVITNYRLQSVNYEGEIIPAMGFVTKGGNL